MLASVFAKTTRDRWKGMAIAMFSLGLLLWMVMAVYQDIDISAYSELPEVFLSIMGIPEGADVASLAVGVMYGFYGALTLAGLAVSMGSASVAGEERDGTIGLLLGNPKSRTNVLVSKAASMLLLVGLGALALWGAAPLVAGFLDVRMGGMQVGPTPFTCSSMPFSTASWPWPSAPGRESAGWRREYRPGSWPSASWRSASSPSSRGGRTLPKCSPGTTSTTGNR